MGDRRCPGLSSTLHLSAHTPRCPDWHLPPPPPHQHEGTEGAGPRHAIRLPLAPGQFLLSCVRWECLCHGCDQAGPGSRASFGNSGVRGGAGVSGKARCPAGLVGQQVEASTQGTNGGRVHSAAISKEHWGWHSISQGSRPSSSGGRQKKTLEGARKQAWRLSLGGQAGRQVDGQIGRRTRG